MKKNNIYLFTTLFILLTACVQNSYNKTIQIKLLVNKKQNIKTVTIKGNKHPLGWYEEKPMEEIVKDSLYKATIQVKTAYQYCQIKFVVNDEVEFKDDLYRKIQFKQANETIIYNATFNQKD